MSLREVLPSILGTSPNSLCAYINKYDILSEQRLVKDDQTAKLKRLKVGLERVTEDRNIQKRLQLTL